MKVKKRSSSFIKLKLIDVLKLEKSDTKSSDDDFSVSAAYFHFMEWYFWLLQFIESICVCLTMKPSLPNSSQTHVLIFFCGRVSSSDWLFWKNNNFVFINTKIVFFYSQIWFFHCLITTFDSYIVCVCLRENQVRVK